MVFGIEKCVNPTLLTSLRVPMAFGVKFIPLTPAPQLPSRRGSLGDITNASAYFTSEEVDKAIYYLDTIMNDFFRNYSQNYSDNNNDCSSSHAESSVPEISIVNDDKMGDELETSEEHDNVFSDLTFLESSNPQQFDFSGDQSSIPESNEFNNCWTRMAELRALLLETFPDGMPEEIDYESILADQHIPSDPLDPSFWNYFQGSAQTKYTAPDEQ